MDGKKIMDIAEALKAERAGTKLRSNPNDFQRKRIEPCRGTVPISEPKRQRVDGGNGKKTAAVADAKQFGVVPLSKAPAHRAIKKTSSLPQLPKHLMKRPTGRR
eukprot:GHVO01004847.1.p2 GENE.GHVO01004847.1~~GHVO01004847.1.p2  ORF type:complete len:104 (-),score=17.99 GHVO01004847.1:84-395(-)